MKRNLELFVQRPDLDTFPKNRIPVTFSIATSDKFKKIEFLKEDLSTVDIDITANPDKHFTTPDVMSMKRHYFKLEEFTVDLAPGKPAYARVLIKNISGEVGGVLFFRKGSSTKPQVLYPSSDKYKYRRYGIRWVKHPWWITSNHPSTLEYTFKFNIPKEV